MGVKFTNNAVGALASSITNVATTIFVVSGQGAYFPGLAAGEYFFATLIDSSNNLEIVKVTARTTDTLTVVRGQDGTGARAYAAGDKIELRIVAGSLSHMLQDDGSIPLTADMDAGTHKIVNLATPTGTTDAATKGYVDTTVATEATARTSADTTLTNSLNTEITNRTNADTTLTNNLNTEITNRTNADNALSTAISAKPSATGTGASGTWPINITGNAGSASGIQGITANAVGSIAIGIFVDVTSGYTAHTWNDGISGGNIYVWYQNVGNGGTNPSGTGTLTTLSGAWRYLGSCRSATAGSLNTEESVSLFVRYA